MDFWEWCCQPALIIETDKRDYSDNAEARELREENKKLKLLVRKMMEKQIHEEKRKEIDFDEN